MDSVRFTLASFAFIFAVITSLKAFSCPELVPTDEDTSAIAGNWYLTQMMAIGIPIPEIKCFMQTNEVNDGGSLTSSQSLVETQSDSSYYYESSASPIDHVRARLGFQSILSQDNIAIYTILRIVPHNYFITAGCITVEGVLGLKLNVFAGKSVLDDKTMDEIKQFLANSNLPNNLTTIDQVNCTDNSFPGT